MAKIRHITVGEGLSSTEWASEDIHELVEGGDLIISQPPTSEPPNTFHKIYNIYAKKIGDDYHLVMVVETEPE